MRLNLNLNRSLQSRLLIGAAVWGLVVLAATGFLLHYLLRTQLEANLRQRLANDLNQLLAQIETRPNKQPILQNQLSDPLYQRIYSGHYWQISQDDRSIARSRSLWDQQLVVPNVDGSAPQYAYTRGPRDMPLLTYTRRVTLPGVAGELRLQVTTDVRKIDAALTRFGVVLTIGFGALALGLILAALLQVRMGLRPLQRMRRGLAEIRDGQARSLQGEYPTEVQPLVDDLNHVLADNQCLIDRARSRAGNLAHALKTPLSIITNEADAQHQRGDRGLGDRLLREAAAMQRHIDWHLAHARIAATRRPGSRTVVAEVLTRLQRTLIRLYPERRIEIVQADHALTFQGEAQDLEQMLGNLMDNACKWAAKNIRVSVAAQESALLIGVEDDGPGLAPEAREKVIGRGKRMDENTPGDGLGLSIVQELAQAYGGSLELVAAATGGLSAQLRLPRA